MLRGEVFDLIDTIVPGSFKYCCLDHVCNNERPFLNCLVGAVMQKILHKTYDETIITYFLSKSMYK